MAKVELNLESLYSALDVKREERGLTWKQVSNESGVNPSTLTRMAQGKRPDADGLTALVIWGGLKLEDFVIGRTKVHKNETDTLSKVAAYLRADPHLTKESAEALSRLLVLSYQHLKDGKPKGV